MNKLRENAFINESEILEALTKKTRSSAKNL